MCVKSAQKTFIILQFILVNVRNQMFDWNVRWNNKNKVLSLRKPVYRYSHVKTNGHVIIINSNVEMQKLHPHAGVDPKCIVPCVCVCCWALLCVFFLSFQELSFSYMYMFKCGCSPSLNLVLSLIKTSNLAFSFFPVSFIHMLLIFSSQTNHNLYCKWGLLWFCMETRAS